MRIVSVKNLEPGMVLAKSVYTYNNNLLLGAGFRLDQQFKAKLLERGIQYVHIMEEGTESVVPQDIISDEIQFQARSRLGDSSEKIQRYFRFKELSRAKAYDLLKKGYLKDFNITQEMMKVVNEILADISSVGARFIDTPLFKSGESYHTDHAINTTLLATLIGKKYGFNKIELQNLALGSFLHDFGKIVLEKMQSASDESVVNELLKEHPTFGYLMIHNSRNASPVVCQIINQHHEAQDGSGYPVGLRGENLPPTTSVKRTPRGMIYRLAEVCSVANAFDNLVLNPLAEKQLGPADAIRELVKGAGTVYNKHIVNTLVDIVPAFPVGAMVRIVNIVDASLIGHRAVVAKINEHHLNRPVIILLFDRHGRKVQPRIIDTSKLKTIRLELEL